MKNLILLLFLFLFLSSNAQKISGIYMGTLYNDSTKMVQNYELALSEYRGKITGYSYVTFVSRDTFYYGIRKIKANIVNDELVVEDDQIILNNFPESPAKKVKRTTTIPLNGQDSIVNLKGRWKTNKTKEYYSVPGSIALNRNGDSSRSALVGHLRELGIIPQEDTHTYDPTLAMATPVKEVEPDTKTVAKTKTKVKADKSNNNSTSSTTSGSSSSVASIDTKSKVKTKLPDTQNSTPITKSESGSTVKAATPKVPDVLPFDQRKVRLMQTLNVTSDSLILSFYDNGVIDGDSITVYLNGVNIISHNRLTAVASKKTIDISKLGDKIELLVIADNLGSIPPNTGLVVVRDGDNTYQVNFTADMQTNASLVFYKQKK